MDRRVSELAARQYGVAAFGQLLGLGLGEHGVYERARTGRLLRLYRGTTVARTLRDLTDVVPKQALKRAVEPPHLTRSELENRFLALCLGHKIPDPLTNLTVCGYGVDAFCPQAKLAVELDGHAAHA